MDTVTEKVTQDRSYIGNGLRVSLQQVTRDSEVVANVVSIFPSEGDLKNCLTIKPEQVTTLIEMLELVREHARRGLI